MSQENVELIRRLYAQVRFDRDDPESFQRAYLSEADTIDASSSFDLATRSTYKSSSWC
jgi:hypothetical protein